MSPSDQIGGGRGPAHGKRKLRAILAADIANFSGRVSINETNALSELSAVLKIAREAVSRFDGQLISMTGDGLFVLFESAVDAVECALEIQSGLRCIQASRAMPLRIGLHLGEVLFEDDIACGEALNIAARLESLADPGGILVSGAVFDAVSARIPATFEPRGMPRLKNIPRQINTFAVRAAGTAAAPADALDDDPLDRTVEASYATLKMAAGPPDALAGATAAAPSPPQAPDKPVITPPVSAQDAAADDAPGWPPDSDAVAVLLDTLTIYVGPVARIVLPRASKTATTWAQLLDLLEQAIPSATDRQFFRAEIKRRL